MNRLVFLIIVLIKISQAYGENPCGIMTPQNSGQWGIGFIWFSPNSQVPVYDKPNGEKVGTVTRNQYGGLIFEKKNSQGDFQTNQNDFVWAGHVTVTLLKTYKIKFGFLNILVQSKDSGLWINLKDHDKVIKFVKYQAVLLNSEKEVPTEIQDLIRNNNIGVNLPGSCLNLRKENNADSEIVKCISSNKPEDSGHSHLKIVEIKDDWAKVEVTVYEYDNENDESGEGCSFRHKEKYSGWIKYLSKSGHPNIWYSTGTH